MGKVYEVYELLEAIANGEITEKSNFIVRGGTYDGHKAHYQKGNIIINSFGQNVMMGTKLLSEDCTFELLEDEEIDKREIEELNVPISTHDYNWQDVDRNRMKINEMIRVINKMQKDNKIKEK